MTATDMMTTEHCRFIAETEKVLPKGLFRLYGCVGCEFRHSRDCPYFNTGDGLTHPPDGMICNQRKLWLATITPDYDSPVTLAQWQRDVNLKLGHSRQLAEERVVDEMRERVDTMRKRGYSDDELRSYEQRLDRAKDRLNMVWRNVTEYADRQVHRETPAKKEVTHNVKVTPFDVAQMIKDGDSDAVDADFEEVEDGDGNNET